MTQFNKQQKGQAGGKQKREIGEYHRVCGTTVGIVFALDESTAPLFPGHENGDAGLARPLQDYKGQPAVCQVVETCCRAQMTEVFVVTTPHLADRVSFEVSKAKRGKNSSPVQVVAIERWALDDRDAEAPGFEVLGLKLGELELVGGLAGTVLDGYDAALVMSAENVFATRDHLYEACRVAAEDTAADAVCASMGGRRCQPCVFTRGLLESLEQKAADAPDSVRIVDCPLD